MWLLLMFMPCQLDFISPIEPTVEVVEDTNCRENLDSSDDVDNQEDLTLPELEIPAPVDRSQEIIDRLEKILENLEKIQENSGKRLDENEEFEKMLRKVVSEEIDKAFKEREKKKEPPKAVPAPKTVEEPKPAVESSEVTLYFYPMPGCEPCERMKRELVTSNMGIPLMQGRYPCTFRDGTPVAQYPSAELMDGDKLVKRWVGYTPAYAIRDEYELYTLNQTR